MKVRISVASVIIRSAWIIMAIILLVFCGPIRRFIELKISTGNIAYSSQNIDKKPRMGSRVCREKKDIAELSQCLSSPPPTSILSTFNFTDFDGDRSNDFTSKYGIHLNNISGTSLYLSLQKLQV